MVTWHCVGQRLVEIKDFEGNFGKSADKKFRKNIFGGQSGGDKNQKRNPATIDFQ